MSLSDLEKLQQELSTLTFSDPRVDWKKKYEEAEKRIGVLENKLKQFSVAVKG